MPDEVPPRSNQLEQLRADICALEDREHREAHVVQVPRERANDIVGMDAQQWREGSRGFLSDSEIDDILTRISADGPLAIRAVRFGNTHIEVASSVEDDCGELTILEGPPMDSQ